MNSVLIMGGDNDWVATKEQFQSIYAIFRVKSAWLFG